jgi:hypothetical protein
VDDYVYTAEVQNPLTDEQACNFQYTTDYVTWHSVSGLNEGEIIWRVFTDGFTVYASGTSGLWAASPGGTFYLVIGQSVGLGFCGCANGRVIMTSGPTVYDVTSQMGAKDGSAPGSLTGAGATMGSLGTQVGNAQGVAFTGIPGSVWSHSNPNWYWDCITSGQSGIYLGGYAQNSETLAGTLSAVYLLQEDTATGALLPGSIALSLETNETVGGLYFYINYVIVGTNRGYRCCSIAGTNNPDSQSGCLIPGPMFPNQLQPFEPIFASQAQLAALPGFGGYGMVGYDRFVWFGWPSYDSESVGMGRIDLSQMLVANGPAYASDLMITSTTAQVQIMFWCPITNGPAILCGDASGGTAGLYTRKVNSSGFPVPVASGTLNSGRFTFGIPDQKMLCQANYHTATDATLLPNGVSGYPVGGTVSLSSNPDGTGWTALSPLAPDTQTNPPVLLDPLTSGEDWNILITLEPDTVDDVVYWPFLTRYTVKALPQIVSGATISPVLSLYVNDDYGDQESYNDPYGDYAWLENLRLGQIPLLYQEGGAEDGATQYSAVVVITEVDWLPYKERDTPDSGFEGDLILYVKSLVG